MDKRELKTKMQWLEKCRKRSPCCLETKSFWGQGWIRNEILHLEAMRGANEGRNLSLTA